MGFFGNVIEGVQSRIKESAERKKDEQLLIRRMRLEAEEQRKQIFAEEFRQNALEVARAQAKKDAAQKSGLQKLRAMNRASRLTGQNIESPGMLQKLGEYTQKNLARRDENIKRTKALRDAAKEMRETRLADAQTSRTQKTAVRRPFGGFNGNKINITGRVPKES